MEFRKTFTNNSLNAAQIMEFVFHELENIVGNGENAGNQHFLHFSLCYQNLFSVVKSRICVVEFLNAHYWLDVNNSVYKIHVDLIRAVKKHNQHFLHLPLRFQNAF